jgi:hypothetical protein
VTIAGTPSGNVPKAIDMAEIWKLCYDSTDRTLRCVE